MYSVDGHNLCIEVRVFSTNMDVERLVVLVVRVTESVRWERGGHNSVVDVVDFTRFYDSVGRRYHDYEQEVEENLRWRDLSGEHRYRGLKTCGTRIRDHTCEGAGTRCIIHDRPRRQFRTELGVILVDVERNVSGDGKLQRWRTGVAGATSETHTLVSVVSVADGKNGGEPNLTVKTCTGKMITLQVKGSDTIFDVKSMIENNIHIPVEEQALIFDEQLLEGDLITLANFGINRSSTLTLVHKSRGLVPIFIKFAPTTGLATLLRVKLSDPINN
ncbi:putative ubiquitin domain-containing protein [Tanacetum coccineum]|uniref:Ubiquitin domain-containing protein n=1 Tax=Tanacetum coccineum TaxID=301880 RepID=A0ABQ4YJ61_9ASTR